MNGKVYIVGVGPGDYKLITLKAVECIKKADVIVYDRLIGRKILNFAKDNSEKIFVGKSPNNHSLSQYEINRLLVEQAKKGKIVARVKGGDPFLFGRGGEEGVFLYENKIEFEIIPGITSAISVPAYAGIPVTHRECCSSLHIITGHEREEKEKSSINYKELAKIGGTLVFLMGVKNLPNISKNLIKNGMKRLTPVAVVERGTTFDQRAITGTLEDISHKVLEEKVSSPAAIVVGEVVNFREKLDWFLKGTLRGKRVVVTRAREQASRLVDMIEDLGGEALEFPTIKIEPPDSFDQFDRILENVRNYNWLVFTSPNGVKAFFERLRHKKIDVRSLYNLKVAVIGKVTADEVEKIGINIDYMPDKYTTDELLKGMKKVITPSERILLARSDIGSKELLDGLLENGNNVTNVTVYKTSPAIEDRKELLDLFKKGKIDFITFTSSSTVINFIKAVGRENLDKLSNTKVISIGPVTTKTAIENGINVARQADEHTIAGLVTQLIQLVQLGDGS
ncbi:uroporphyrinogen-III C-methyltransferase [Herbivorax sp. ANBcel31]|uniref:uroporphyrinogen-III C-methyltransferase n=1 Tax=Herbivorax sp. ANBcel31 TaxID=3069754 RepID=UPI0027B62912|nr:uroporphyrinogen-III C-methyltransferase [Herbivorax sp. ANBcel31]MDQ2086955.1 uroporphyrinogen-III C-methyltransferase [Herbivorax sp. ANBcel31]